MLRSQPLGPSAVDCAPASHLVSLNLRAEVPVGSVRRRARTRARLLAGAARAMAAHGFSGLRVVDIADEAQVSHGALYGHFRDSNAVAREVFVGLIRRLYHVERPLRGQPGDPDAARRLVRRHLGALRDDGPLLIALRQALLVDARLARLADLAALYWRRRLEVAIVGPRVGAGEPAHPDILDLAIAGVGARAGREPMPDPVLDRLADEIVRGWLAARSRVGEAADAA